MDTLLAEDVGTSTIDKRLRKKCNVDFLLGEFDVLITIPDDNASNLSEWMDIKATKPPHEPKKDSKDDIDLSGGFYDMSLGYQVFYVGSKLEI